MRPWPGLCALCAFAMAVGAVAQAPDGVPSWTDRAKTFREHDQGRIEGLLVAAVGQRPPGRTDEFRSWARQSDPQELDYLMPDGEVDPAADRPARFRALLARWRQASSLPAIDDVGGASGE